MMFSWLLLFVSAFEFAPPVGLGSIMTAGVAVPTPDNSIRFNPALTTGLQESAVEIATARLYNTPDIFAHGCAFGWQRFAVAGKVSLVGCSGYQEYYLALTRGVDLAQHWSAGVLVSSYGLVVSEELSNFIPALSAGLVYKTDRVSIGGAVLDFNQPVFANGDAIVPRVLAGAAIRPEPNFRAAFDVEYAEGLQFRAGSAFTLHPAMTLAIGMASEPLRYAGGMICRVGHLGLGYSYLLHPKLKQSHVITLSYWP